MRFELPRSPTEFELPDEWWFAAGMKDFVPRSPAYRVAHIKDTIDGKVISLEASEIAAIRLIALDDIEPIYRSRKCPLDFRGFGRDRMIRVLSGIASNNCLPPVSISISENERWPPPHFKYRLTHGTHRFYASIAAGFTSVPAFTPEVAL